MSLVPWIKSVDLKALVRVRFSSIEGEELIKLRGLSSLPVALIRNNATVIPASSHRANTVVQGTIVCLIIGSLVTLNPDISPLRQPPSGCSQY